MQYPAPMKYRLQFCPCYFTFDARILNIFHMLHIVAEMGERIKNKIYIKKTTHTQTFAYIKSCEMKQKSVDIQIVFIRIKDWHSILNDDSSILLDHIHTVVDMRCAAILLSSHWRSAMIWRMHSASQPTGGIPMIFIRCNKKDIIYH